MERPCRKLINPEKKTTKFTRNSKNRWIPPPGKASRAKSFDQHTTERRDTFRLKCNTSFDSDMIDNKGGFVKENICLIISALKHIIQNDTPIDACYLERLVALEPKVFYIIDEIIDEAKLVKQSCHKEEQLCQILNETKEELDHTREILRNSLNCQECQINQSCIQTLKAECEKLSNELKDIHLNKGFEIKSLDRLNRELNEKAKESEKNKKLAKSYKKKFLATKTDLDELNCRFSENQFTLANMQRKLDEVLHEKERADINVDKLNKIQNELRDLRISRDNPNEKSNDSIKLKEENQTLQKEIDSFKNLIQDLEKCKNDLQDKLKERDNQIKSMSDDVNRQKQKVETLQVDLREKNHEARFPSQSFEQMNQRSFSRDNLLEQKRINELELMTKNLENEIHRIQIQNEETEKNARNRICDLKQKLVQADSTNRSLHNYLNFLKRSYSSVFQANCENSNKFIDIHNSKSCMKLLNKS